MDLTMSKKILCAVDGSEHSKRAIIVASEFGQASAAELTLVVVDQVFMDGRSSAVHKLGTEAAEKLLTEAKMLASAEGVSACKLAVIAGRDVSRAILNYAEEHHIDHIVVGTGEKSAATRLIIGSVSHDLVLRAHCSVTVAR